MFFGLNDVAFLAAVSAPALDPDAAAYIAAVEAADTQALEPAVRAAINDFVVGCKADGIWTAIKASCILAGARTLTGALVPLVGTAPTNVGGLFVSGDYNRKTGLVGDGSTKYLNSNRNNNADPQNSFHVSVYVTQVSTSGSGALDPNRFPFYIGTGGNTSGALAIGRIENNSTNLFLRNRSLTATLVAGATTTGFLGNVRTGSSEYVARVGGANSTISQASQTPFNGNIGVFRSIINDESITYSNGRIAFYSIGESLDLALLDARVTALINAIAAAIP
jgi:hypothetical protein